MYAREIDGQTLTLHVSGMLWGDSVVLNNVETRSEWSHILGRAMAGPLRGKELKIISAATVTWRRWREDHPETTVAALSRITEDYTSKAYRRPRDFVLGLKHQGEIVAYPLTELIQRTAISDAVADEPIVAVYDAPGAGAAAYHRTVAGETLDFAVTDGQLVAGGSTWNATTGEALDGPHKGQRLERLPTMIAYEKAWRAYYPGSRWCGE